MRNLRFGATVESAVYSAVVLIVVCVALASTQDFGYGGQHGPNHWGDDFKRCSGKQQSPINIDEQNVVKKEYSDLEYTNFNARPKSVRLTNNGHTVLVTMTFTPGMEPRIKGGPLESDAEYQFEQFHFHWGENDTVGSEDMINNQAYPAEMHVVMRSLDYKDFKSALGKDHGIAVLAFFFRISRLYSFGYGEFTEELPGINKKGKYTTLLEPRPLSAFLPTRSNEYYTYIGSLTTPPCAEKVVWIDYVEPIQISEHQLSLFRELTANDDHLKNNFRPTQPLNSRVVYKNVPKITNTSDWGGTPLRNTAAIAAGTITGGLAFLLSFSLTVLIQGNF